MAGAQRLSRPGNDSQLVASWRVGHAQTAVRPNQRCMPVRLHIRVGSIAACRCTPSVFGDDTMLRLPNCWSLNPTGPVLSKCWMQHCRHEGTCVQRGHHAVRIRAVTVKCFLWTYCSDITQGAAAAPRGRTVHAPPLGLLEEDAACRRAITSGPRMAPPWRSWPRCRPAHAHAPVLVPTCRHHKPPQPAAPDSVPLRAACQLAGQYSVC